MRMKKEEKRLQELNKKEESNSNRNKKQSCGVGAASTAAGRKLPEPNHKLFVGRAKMRKKTEPLKMKTLGQMSVAVSGFVVGNSCQSLATCDFFMLPVRSVGVSKSALVKGITSVMEKIQVVVKFKKKKTCSSKTWLRQQVS